MKSLRRCSIALSIAWILAVLPCFAQMNSAQEECRCHSKQPAIKRMHETIGFNGCGNCHAKNEDLMSRKDRPDPGKKAVLAKRIREDTFCVPCHDSNGSVKKEIYAGKREMTISGTSFCPKDKLRFAAGTKSCSKCGGPLININQVMAISSKNPSNEICIGCHAMEEVIQIDRHKIYNNNKLSKCLDCHKGHDDCGSCHH
jgi:hypothetical protein